MKKIAVAFFLVVPFFVNAQRTFHFYYDDLKYAVTENSGGCDDGDPSTFDYRVNGHCVNLRSGIPNYADYKSVDKKGRLWYAIPTGVAAYDPINDTVEIYSSTKHFGPNNRRLESPYNVLCDADKNLAYVLQADSIYYYDLSSRTVVETAYVDNINRFNGNLTFLADSFIHMEKFASGASPILYNIYTKSIVGWGRKEVISNLNNELFSSGGEGYTKVGGGNRDASLLRVDIGLGSLNLYWDDLIHVDNTSIAYLMKYGDTSKVICYDLERERIVNVFECEFIYQNFAGDGVFIVDASNKIISVQQGEVIDTFKHKFRDFRNHFPRIQPKLLGLSERHLLENYGNELYFYSTDKKIAEKYPVIVANQKMAIDEKDNAWTISNLGRLVKLQGNELKPVLKYHHSWAIQQAPEIINENCIWYASQDSVFKYENQNIYSIPLPDSLSGLLAYYWSTSADTILVSTAFGNVWKYSDKGWERKFDFEQEFNYKEVYYANGSFYRLRNSTLERVFQNGVVKDLSNKIGDANSLILPHSKLKMLNGVDSLFFITDFTAGRKGELIKVIITDTGATWETVFLMDTIGANDNPAIWIGKYSGNSSFGSLGLELNLTDYLYINGENYSIGKLNSFELPFMPNKGLISGCELSNEQWMFSITGGYMKTSFDDLNLSNGSNYSPTLMGVVYPNPAQMQIFIPMNENSTFNVYDVNGRMHVLSNSQLNSQYRRLDVSSLVKGLYFVKVNDGKSTKHFRFIKS